MSKEAEWILYELKKDIRKLKKNQQSQNRDYYTGYISALSTVEGCIAEIEETLE